MIYHAHMIPLNSKTSMSPLAPRIECVRHEPKSRLLRVEGSERLNPAMQRITFSGEDLRDFVSLSPDDHLKIVVPDSSGGSIRRDYTPRRYDSRTRTLVLDFALHAAGPAAQWALHARPGDGLQVCGPRGSAVIAPDVRRWLLIGDETALPAIGRRMEDATGRMQFLGLALRKRALCL